MYTHTHVAYTNTHNPHILGDTILVIAEQTWWMSPPTWIMQTFVLRHFPPKALSGSLFATWPLTLHLLVFWWACPICLVWCWLRTWDPHSDLIGTNRKCPEELSWLIENWLQQAKSFTIGTWSMFEDYWRTLNIFFQVFLIQIFKSHLVCFSWI